jgi:prepilin peptidase CpaA
MQVGELWSVLDLLAMFFFDWQMGLLTILLLFAAIADYRSHRIPNQLVLLGMAFALIDQCVRWPVLEGPLFVIGGILVGFSLFFPMYLLRAMGAGDVKLLAMVGAFLGPTDTFRVALATMIIGGVMAIVFVVLKGTVGRLAQNLRSLFQVGLLDVLVGRAPDLQLAPSLSAGRLPYGVAISAGTMGYLVARQLGFT